MIHGFYYRFYKQTHSKTLSIILAYMARFVFFVRYLIKSIRTEKQIIEMEDAEAIDIIRSASPDPEGRPEYVRESLQPGLDLSVIIPVYNHIQDISACIDSVLEQRTNYSYEVILVDDGSTDGAQELIEQYRSFKSVRIYHQENGGIASARNTGIRHARGKYIMFVDCDDTVQPDIVEELMNSARQNGSDIVMGGHNLVKKSGGTITSVLPNIDPEWNLLGYKNGDEIMNYAGLPWGKVYRRELFEHIRFFPGYWYEDTIIHGLVFLCCKSFSYVPSAVYNYTWNENNFSHIQASNKQLNPKTADRYWLIASIAHHYEEMALPLDAKFYTMILEHVSAYYYKTISNMPEQFVTAMFVAGRALLLKYRPSGGVKLPYMLHLTEKAMIEKDIAHWKLCSMNQ